MAISISIPPKGDEAKRIGSYFAPLKVEAQVSPNLSVRILPGSFYTALGEYREYAGGVSPSISVPTSGAKWVVIAINENSLIQIHNGAASTNPNLPVIPESQLPLAAIFIGDTHIAITSDMVFDIRPLWQIRPENIPNLAGELSSRPTITDINLLLANKADIGGTPSTSFILNQDHVGVPGADVELVVERGANPNVSIRWNETVEQWEFSNDGITWDPVGASSGVFYTQSQLNGGVLDFRYYTRAELDTGVLDMLYYNQTTADATFATISHTHMSVDIGDFGTAAASAAPVQSVAGKTGAVLLLESDIVDLDKYDTVVGAVVGHVVQFGAGSLADSGIVTTNISLVGHTHVTSNITNFTTNVNALIGAANVGDLNNVVTSSPVDGHVLVFNGTSSWYISRFLDIGELGDVTETFPANKHVLINNGVNYINRLLDKNDISDFVEGDYVHLTGNETISGTKSFVNDVVIQGNLTVQGPTTAIETTELRVKDKVFDLNYGETGAGVGGATPQDAGMRVKRGTEPDALMFWDETSNQWIAGVVGLSQPIVLGAHSHIWTEILDFGPGVTFQLNLNNLDRLQDVSYPVAPLPANYLRYNGTNWVPSVPVSADISDFGNAVTIELNNNNLDEIQDVYYSTPPTAGELLFYDAFPAGWSNRLAVKADISNFIESDYVHTFGTETVNGNKTFGNDVIITGDLTVQGTTTTVNSTTLEITDNIIVVNNGEIGAGVSAGNAGMRVDRGTLTDALFVWDELNQQWEAGTIGSMLGISRLGHQHIVADITNISVSALDINQLAGIMAGPSGVVQTQLNDRIRRSINEAMNPAINLSFSGGGEVLGLPATPSSGDAATSRTYVDGVISTLTSTVTTHISDDSRHLTTNQNTFLDGLNLPVLTSTEVNYLQGSSSNIQAQINGKANLTIPLVVNDIALLDLSGDLVDSGYRLNDGGVTVNDLWSASKLTTELNLKADKVSGAIVGNFAGLDASGNLTDSGSSVSTFAFASHTHDAANVITGTFADARIAVSNVTQHVASIDHNLLLNYALGEHRTINDVGVTVTDLWSASKITSELVLKSNVGHTHIATDVTDFASAVDARISTFSGSVALVLDNLADVIDTGTVVNDVLRHNGSSWTNVQLVKNHITDFNETDYVHKTGVEAINGDKTFNNGVVVVGDLTVQGTTTTVNSSTVEIGDSIITLNANETGAPSISAGVEIERGTEINSIILWDEVDDLWKVGTVGLGSPSGSVATVAREGITPAQPAYEIQTAVAVVSSYTFATITVPVPVAGKTAIQVFVNGIKYREGVGKQFTVSAYAPVQLLFAAGAEPPIGADVEVYGFGTIG